jgi:hypothetical protein
MKENDFDKYVIQDSKNSPFCDLYLRLIKNTLGKVSAYLGTSVGKYNYMCYEIDTKRWVLLDKGKKLGRYFHNWNPRCSSSQQCFTTANVLTRLFRKPIQQSSFAVLAVYLNTHLHLPWQ